ncbi:MAG: hypothetical protein RIS29_356 [Bacteroidota bacterium]|jgi:ABC-type Fe3+ transport system substrate-binding protein
MWSLVDEKKKSCACSGMQHADSTISEEAEKKQPILLALLPCGLRNPFHQTILAEFPQYASFANEDIVVEGNLNYEKSFYGSLDRLTSTDSLPDIFISSDVNNLYYSSFRENMLQKDFFEVIVSEVNPLFQAADYNYPASEFNCFTTNVLVPVIDTQKLNDRPVPVSWDELLQGCFEKDITLRGDKDFFCNAVFFPFYKNYGKVALTELGRNTKTGLHPSEMVKKMNAGNGDGTCLYVMPYSFATKIRDKERFKVLTFREGGIISPVQMLIKKGAYTQHKELIDFILSSKMANTLNQNGFPTSNPYGSGTPGFEKLWWIGPDFIATHDIAAIKDEMPELFYKGFQ